jgi:hypothetical protein
MLVLPAFSQSKITISLCFLHNTFLAKNDFVLLSFSMDNTANFVII